MRDSIDAFLDVDTIPFGVNPADAASHQAFIDKHDFPFDLLVDEGRAVADRYGAVKPDGSGIQRTVVIVGKNGKIIYKEPGAPAPALMINAIKAANDTPA